MNIDFEQINPNKSFWEISVQNNDVFVAIINVNRRGDRILEENFVQRKRRSDRR